MQCNASLTAVFKPDAEEEEGKEHPPNLTSKCTADVVVYMSMYTKPLNTCHGEYPTML
jgi:hypothetical protein